MKSSKRSLALVAASALFSAGFAIASGCSSDDSSVNGSAEDSGTSGDATFPSDSALPPQDAGPAEASAIDAGHTHKIFITSGLGFYGNLLGEAAVIANDAGLDAGDLATADGGGRDYRVAGDLLCAQAAARAGLPGTFEAILSAGSDPTFRDIADSDGPWSLVDGTPVADSLDQLTSGNWYVPILVTEYGVLHDLAGNGVWSAGAAPYDCKGYSSASGSDESYFGIGSTIGSSAISYAGLYCNEQASLRCIEVGSGGAPNHFPSIPSGGKIAFVTDSEITAAFALPDAGVLTSSPPDAGDAVHSVADAICNGAATLAGRSGTYHAYVSSSTTPANAYFASLGMTGPWYRTDGIEIAATLADLPQVVHAPIDRTADGGFRASAIGDGIFTGTLADGGVTQNCGDYTSQLPTDLSYGADESVGGFGWQGDYTRCNGAAKLVCFEQ